ncbi:MAG: hypothetical protein ACHQRM_09180 [Bacteroidia bacterium]
MLQRSCYILWFVLLAAGQGVSQQRDTSASPGFIRVSVFSPSDLEQPGSLFQAIPAKPPVAEKPVPGPLMPLPRKGKWILKFNPLLIVRGDVPLYLERRLSHNVSIEAAAGVTFRDYFKQVLLENQPLDKNDPNVSELSGLSGKFAIRFYPHHTAPGDFYFSPEMDLKNYRKDVNGIYVNSSGNYVRGTLHDQQKYLDFYAVCGSQNTLELDEYIYLDWYIGVGVRLGQESNVTNSELNAATIELKQQRIAIPVLNLGVKLGFGI